MKERMKHLFLFIVIVGIDQAVKYWVKQTLMNQDPIVIIPNILNLQYHENTGAVWGIMSDKTKFLSIFTILILILIVYIYFKIPKDKKFGALKIIAVFIVAGAVGNLIDRVILGHVVDYIYFEIINFPLFNIADSFLTVSCILLFILSITYYKDDDFTFLEEIFRSRGKKAAGRVTTDTEIYSSDAKDEDTILFDRSKEEEANDSKDADKSSDHENGK